MRDKFVWFKGIFQLRGSVVPSIIPRVLFCGSFGFLISIFHYFQLPVSFKTGSIIPSIVLGLLLVFRTNTAYDRFWEGRRLWGTLIIAVRNLSRQIWVSVDEKEPDDFANKKVALQLLPAFAVALKLHLRGEKPNEELQELLSPIQYEKLQSMNNPPLEIAFWLADYLNKQYERNCLDIFELTALNQIINKMIEALSGCERILRTPIPLAYAIHLKQLLLLYCLLLPLEIVKDFGWGTGFVIALISFTLLGIEQIGVEIENPFGLDANDLPLDTICDTMKRNISDLVSLPPNVHTHVR